MTDVTYLEAATAYPERAKIIDQMHGKRRSRERRKLRDTLQLDRLQQQGRQCSNCVHFEASCPHVGGKSICGLHSDFRGYQLARPDNVCLKHQEPTHD